MWFALSHDTLPMRREDVCLPGRLNQSLYHQVLNVALERIGCETKRFPKFADGHATRRRGHLHDCRLVSGELDAPAAPLLIEIAIDCSPVEFEAEAVGFPIRGDDRRGSWRFVTFDRLVLRCAGRDLVQEKETDKADAIPPLAELAISRPGDLWVLGDHRLYCGDATRPETYAALMAGEEARMVFTDPPYNVRIDGHAGGKGKAERREFVMASGEMSKVQFTAFLTESLGGMAGVCCDGAIAMVCMDSGLLRMGVRP